MAGGKIRKEKPRGGAAAASRSDLSLDKRKGQHMLKNPGVPDSIIQKSGIKPTDVILEIDPGTVNLTKKLLKAEKYVIAVELDPRMVLELKRRFQGTSFSNRLKLGSTAEVDQRYKAGEVKEIEEKTKGRVL